ncbi:conserved Plasmodium protein, unknown function [Plasmodium vivax]|uniref:Uncharacterized protein n=6 Tax=Plasmodium vivax TaxID=5855 RepID=A5K111_PLAVS|nr:hypothetical protein, conserved [Plasmodium vivax]KMZ78195.1 hypothetical protein PVIIG_02194 [Plasmodium vivax India VII]KMZ83800.1 hypothetical protein PVBG_00880 [Plasmodium vivax Brazil I]KMZ90637.1 hypothetical protein PVMG_02806 [Plasmodium vivax Mauritania I]KMZ97324.1 hypothetical protein PVNG_01154 [Plasmodium vivax North Korean]EDL47008.1 hypothetical protein, conserved [Plasmodium vivax]|eukprot:XP_001616735.1 hypothetical protein [Plasmodium vivax Sal-1]
MTETEGSSPNGDVEAVGKSPPKGNSKKCKCTYKRRELEGGAEAEGGDEQDRSLKKMNSSRDMSEETKPPDLFINYYYEWEDIPTVSRLPYGLIGKEKDALWKSSVRSGGIPLGGNLSDDPTQGEEVNVKCEALGITDEVKLAGGAQGGQPAEGGGDFVASLIYEDIVEHIQKIRKRGSKLRCASGHIAAGAANETDAADAANVANAANAAETLRGDYTKGSAHHCTDQQEGEANWVDDFVALTNIQILAKNTQVFAAWEKLEVVLPYVTTQCGSPRSCLCKKSFLTMKHLCMSIKGDKLNVCKYFVKCFPHVVRKMDSKNRFLDECASQLINLFMKQSSGVNDYQMLRVMCSFSGNKNSSIIKKLSFFVFLFLKNLPTSELVSLPVRDFAQCFLHFINAKLEETKRYMKQTFSLLLTVHSEDDLVSFLLEGAPKKGSVSSLEREIRAFLRSRSCGDVCEPLKKKYATFHQFRSSKSVGRAHKTSSFVL